MGSEWSSEALLWFQTRMDGEHLSVRVHSVTEQGYGVEVESRGQNVAASLIAEQLAKVPGEIPKETYASMAFGDKQQESVKENDHSQIQVQASNQTSSLDISTKEQTVAAPSGQLELASSRWNALIILGAWLNLYVLFFSSIFSSGLEDRGAASQQDLSTLHCSCH